MLDVYRHQILKLSYSSFNDQQFNVMNIFSLNTRKLNYRLFVKIYVP